MSSDGGDDEVLTATITPTSDLDKFYTDEVCPVDFEEAAFPKSSTRLAKDIPQEEPRQLWEKYMSGDNYQVRVRAADGINLAVDVSDNPEYIRNPNGEVPPLLAFVLVLIMPGQAMLTVAYVDPVMKNGVPDYLVQLLGARILHWVARQHISQIASEVHKQSIFDFLLVYLAHESQWSDLYDASILRAKWLLLSDYVSSDDSDSPHRAVNKVGEVLEAQKKYGKAAALYQAASSLTEISKEKALLNQNAGLAWKRGGQYEVAEKAYLDSFALWMEEFSPSTFNPNNATITHPLMNLSILYETWARERCDDDGRMERSEAFEIQAPLLALLCATDWQFNGNIPYQNKAKEVLQFGILNQKLSRVKARKLLFQAFKLGDAKEFRAKILSMRNLRVADMIVPLPNQNANKRDIQRNIRQTDKNTTRNLLRPDGFGSLGTCDNCTQPGDRMMRCPCHTVAYCGKPCQIAHWKAGHKDICPIRKKK